MGRKKWNAAKIDKELASRLASKYDIDPFAALLLVSRKITKEDQIEDFFSQECVLCDPFDLIDMDKAVQRIEDAIQIGERIAIYGDYDADGVTSTAVLFLFLEMLGANVTYYIPDRNTEGYGMNKNAVKKLHEGGVSLIITVDNGISAFEEAELIYELGMELVITDHHKVGSKIPKAEAVVDAHRPDCTCAYKEWSGVGIAFKLMCALSDGEYDDILDSFCDIIAIGTIGDVVSLIGENRALVKQGLKKINSNPSLGVEALKKIAGAENKNLTAVGTAFSIVPRINAVGRISEALDAFRLLISDSPDEAEQLSKKINEANVERQRLEQLIMQQVNEQIERRPELLYDRVLVFDGVGWHAGVIGIVAARLVETYLKPCIVISDNGEIARGSARSVEGFSLYDAVSACAPLLSHYGGHTLAAGFALKSENIENFRKAINDYAKTVDMPFATVNIDCKLRPEFISADILPTIESLEPFGAGNEQPLFGLYKMQLVSITPIGGGKHLRLGFKRENSTITALKFSQTAEEFPFVPGDVLDLAVRLEKNEYNGQTRASVYVRDMRMSGTDDLKYLYSLRLYEKIKRGERLLKSEALSALPDRKFIASVFRFIRDNGGWGFDWDILCYRLGDDGSSVCKVLLGIDALCELGIFQKNNNKIFVKDLNKKVSLDDCEVLNSLKALCRD